MRVNRKVVVCALYVVFMVATLWWWASSDVFVQARAHAKAHPEWSALYQLLGIMFFALSVQRSK